VDVTKSNITPNAQLQEKIVSYARRFIEQSGREGKERTIEKTKLLHSHSRPVVEVDEETKKAVVYIESDHGTPGPLFKVEDRQGNLVVNYNKRNPLIQALAEARSRRVTDIVDRMCLALARMDGSKTVEKFNAALGSLLEDVA